MWVDAGDLEHLPTPPWLRESEPFAVAQTEAHGRDISLSIGREVDAAGQFLVRLVVGGKIRYEAWFTSHEEDDDA